jgi:RNA polymerase sigma-70 factor (ECF subfamily)
MLNADLRYLIGKARTGDPRAEDELFRRYASRLARLAQYRLCAKLGRRLDAEDVVQSAYRTFFGHLRAGRYEFPTRGGVWRMLAAITVRKLNRQVQWHRAGKRTISAEESTAGAPGSRRVTVEEIARDPAPDRVVEVLEELELIFSKRPVSHRRIVEMRLCGEGIDQIARQVPCCQRTVHRVLAAFRRQLNQRLAIA